MIHGFMANETITGGRLIVPTLIVPILGTISNIELFFGAFYFCCLFFPIFVLVLVDAMFFVATCCSSAKNGKTNCETETEDIRALRFKVQRFIGKKNGSENL